MKWYTQFFVSVAGSSISGDQAELQDRGGQQADHQAEEDGRDRLDPFSPDGMSTAIVPAKASTMMPTKTPIVRGRLSLGKEVGADDGDAQPGRHQHEHATQDN